MYEIFSGAPTSLKQGCEGRFCALTRNAGWFAVLAFGMLVTLISKGNSVRFAFVRGRPNPKLRPQL
jgi:hypothetical protein